jgi:pimeloyl-ACP methyl ester carboxylesterase
VTGRSGRAPVRRETRVVHGHRRAFLRAGPPLGRAPVLLLVHGIGDSSSTWLDVLDGLAETHTVIAPDLLGHGASDKPRADYSVGGFANAMRDLLVLLGVERATVVGHSLGGGVAMQLAYQYPELVERLVLVASGGLGREVNPVLRLTSLPGASVAVGVSTRAPVRLPALAASRLAARAGLLEASDVEEVADIWAALRDPRTRRAFLRTLRSVVDGRGQSFTARDRLYLAAEIPTLLVWGERDPLIPVRHAHAAAAALPGLRVEVVPRAGHLPHRSDPRRFVASVGSFVASTPPAVHDARAWRALLAGGDAGDPLLDAPVELLSS